MTTKLIECVPNFSEGRRPEVVGEIAQAIESAGGAVVLHRHLDADHNRSVITFAAPPDQVVEAAFRGVAKAVERIDLNRHQGAHPRIGAADVVPLVPLGEVAMEECVGRALELAGAIWNRLGVPVYLYEAAARRPQRAHLELIRRGQFERLREEIGVDPERAPDVGEARLHPTAGACVVGARKLLIAYNVNLAGGDLDAARRIARAVRASSGGLPAVKAMGVWLASRGLAQVSMNLTDFEITPPHAAYQAVCREAARLGVEVLGAELVGLIPRRALELAGSQPLGVDVSGLILEDRLGAIR